MSIQRDKAKLIRIDENTVGGNTNWVILPGWSEARALCFRRLKGDKMQRCTRTAGDGTDHLGTGACKFHGGRNSQRPTITSGKYAIATKHRLQSQIETYLNQDRSQLLDMTRELASIKAILGEVINEFPDTSAEDYGTWLFRFNSLVMTMSNLVEKVSRIDNRNTLTAAQVLYLRATIVDIMMKYLPDPDTRERVAVELAQRLGGNIEIEMRPSETFSMGGVIDA